MIMQARLKAGWITEADLARRRRGRRRAEPRPRRRKAEDDRSAMLAHVADNAKNWLDAGPRGSGPGAERLCAVTRR